MPRAGHVAVPAVVRDPLGEHADRAARWPAPGILLVAQAVELAQPVLRARSAICHTIASSASWEVRWTSITCRYIAVRVSSPRSGPASLRRTVHPGRASVSRADRASTTAATDAAASRATRATSWSTSSAERAAFAPQPRGAATTTDARPRRGVRLTAPLPSGRGRGGWRREPARRWRGVGRHRVAGEACLEEQLGELADGSWVDVEEVQEPHHERARGLGRLPWPRRPPPRPPRRSPSRRRSRCVRRTGRAPLAAAPGRARPRPGRSRGPAAARAGPRAARRRAGARIRSSSWRRIRPMTRSPCQQDHEGREVLDPVADAVAARVLGVGVGFGRGPSGLGRRLLSLDLLGDRRCLLLDDDPVRARRGPPRPARTRPPAPPRRR